MKIHQSSKQRTKTFVFLSGLLVFFLFLGFFLSRPVKLDSASLTSASATLSNSRLSFSGQVLTGASAGATTINIKITGNIADTDTNHIFPKDTISVGPNGNKTVASVVDDNTFMLSVGLTAPASDADPIYATQSGTLTVTFTTANAIPAGGDVIIIIPANGSDNNDGAPDTADSTVNNGFDFNGITTANVTCPTGANWSITEATASIGAGHSVVCTTDSEVAGSSSLTVVIGDGTKGLVNPAPIYSGHIQGLADTYTIGVQTRDAANLGIDDVNTKVAPVEAVLVSATVDETLTFQVQGITAGTAACGAAVDITTTAYSVPWGTLSIADTFKDGAQQLTVSTNADAGYSVKIEENDQMGKNGAIGIGATAGEANNCIQDTTCSVSGCDQATGYNWIDDDAYHGLGYSLENVGADTDAVFVYNSDNPCSEIAGAGAFCAKQFADQEVPETKATIMCGGGGNCASNGPVSSKDVYVCYRIAISATQPAGYYYNKVKYTATAIF